MSPKRVPQTYAELREMGERRRRRFDLVAIAVTIALVATLLGVAFGALR